MIIFGREIIDNFIARHPDAKSSLNVWHDVVSRAEWKNIIEMRQTYSHADAVGSCTVFNIKGNHYRLVVKINYRAQVMYIRQVLTHAEYDKGKWKSACG
jgi:mRNA interferase HigB